MSKDIKIWSVYVLICTIWGTSWSVVKIGLIHYPPLLFASLRFILSTVFLSLFLRKEYLQVLRTRNFWFLVITVALFAYAVPTTLMYYGQLVVSSSLASVLFSTFPLWVILGTKIYLPSERVTVNQGIGVVLGFIGVFLILYPIECSLSLNTSMGMLAIVASAFIQVIPLIIARKYAAEYESVWYNFLAMGIAAILLFVLSNVFHEQVLQPVSLFGILSILYLGIFATALSFVGYFWLTTVVSPVILSLTAFITPLIAIFIGTIVFHEEWSLKDTVGTVAILTGFLLTFYRKNSSLKLEGKALK